MLRRILQATPFEGSLTMMNVRYGCNVCRSAAKRMRTERIEWTRILLRDGCPVSPVVPSNPTDRGTPAHSGSIVRL